MICCPCAYQHVHVLARLPQLLRLPVFILQDEPVEVGQQLDLLVDPLLLLLAPALLAGDPQLHGDVVAKVELLLAGKVVGALKVFDRVVQGVLLQEGLAWNSKKMNENKS